MREIFKDIKGFEGRYQVSNTGKVLNVRTNRLLKPDTTALNYKRVTLYSGTKGSKKHLPVHRLVALAFVPNPEGYPIVNHKDENPANNCASNLEWCTQKYNLNYKNRNRKLRASLNAKHVQQLGLDGEFIAEYRSAQTAALLLNYDFSHLYKCCRGELKSAYGYLWEYV